MTDKEVSARAAWRTRVNKDANDRIDEMKVWRDEAETRAKEWKDRCIALEDQMVFLQKNYEYAKELSDMKSERITLLELKV